MELTYPNQHQLEINASDIVVSFNSEDADYVQVVTFTEAEHKNLRKVFELAACNPNYDENFSFTVLFTLSVNFVISLTIAFLTNLPIIGYKASTTSSCESLI